MIFIFIISHKDYTKILALKVTFFKFYFEIVYYLGKALWTRGILLRDQIHPAARLLLLRGQIQPAVRLFDTPALNEQSNSDAFQCCVNIS